jgi:hypothetical protein
MLFGSSGIKVVWEKSLIQEIIGDAPKHTGLKLEGVDVFSSADQAKTAFEKALKQWVCKKCKSKDVQGTIHLWCIENHLCHEEEKSGLLGKKFVKVVDKVVFFVDEFNGKESYAKCSNCKSELKSPLNFLSESTREFDPQYQIENVSHISIS